MTNTRTITEAEYAGLQTKSEGRCMFCWSRFTANRQPHVEFCPDTGEPRYLLCRGCFRTLDDFNHDLDQLQRAVTLLEAA